MWSQHSGKDIKKDHYPRKDSGLFCCLFKVAKMEGKSAGFLKNACNLKRHKNVKKDDIKRSKYAIFSKKAS